MIEIPIIGHRFRILQSAGETGGKSLRLEYCAPPRGNAPEHIHPRQEARLRVTSGTLGFRVGDREQTLDADQSAVGPAGVPHA
ncbi:MAG: cupin domain-containing protein [Rubrobacter sp.]